MIISDIIALFEGKTVLYADESNKNGFLSVINRLGISAKVEADAENGGVFVTVRPSSAKKIASALDKSGIIVYINSVCGIRSILARGKRRPGLLIGAVVFFMMLMISTAFVFKVEIKGSELISKDEIRGELAELGVRAGARISDIDRGRVTAEFLTAHPEFAWAALNVKGTTVSLELKEKSASSPMAPEKYGMLVAETDAVIKYLTVISGKPLVASGTAVKKGDLLISGFVSGSGLQYTDAPLLRYDGAAGEVYGEIRSEISVYVPFEESAEVVRAQKRSGTRFSLLGAAFTLGNFCDDAQHKVGSEKNLTVFGSVELPITVTECYLVEKETVITVRDELQAEAEARIRAYKALNSALSGAILTETEIITKVEENGVTVTLRYGCVKNVAVPKDIQK